MAGELLLSWRMNDGGVDGSDIVKSEIAGGSDGINCSGTWMKSATFGRVMDFSTAPSYVRVPGAVFEAPTFTVSVWLMAPRRVPNDRVIVSGTAEGKAAAGFVLSIEGATGALRLRVPGLTFSDPGGRDLVDDRWHHVTVTYDGAAVTFTVDGEIDRRVSASGRMARLHGLMIGAFVDERHTFDGQLAELRLFRGAVEPDRTTAAVLREEDNRPRPPRWRPERGILLSGDALASPPDPSDIRLVREMGFDHATMLVDPAALMDRNMGVAYEAVNALRPAVDAVVAAGLRCVLALHPVYPFNEKYLVEGEMFDRLLDWYGDLGTHIARHWGPDSVAFCPLDSPYANTPESAWYGMVNRIWSVLRNRMPGHLLILCADRGGSPDRLRLMAPANDPNVIYAFSYFEPFSAAYNSGLTAMRGVESFWNYLCDLPYPVPMGLSEEEKTALVRRITAGVPAAWRREADTVVRAYLDGTYDSSPLLPNPLPIPYGAEWHRRRMQALSEWRAFFGGRVQMYVCGFGCLDHGTACRRLGVPEDAFFDPAARLSLIRDMRTAFEAFGIGWNYWGLDGLFCLRDPATRDVDGELLAALGLAPQDL